MVYAIESSRHLSVWLLRASLKRRASLKARADEMIPLLDDENINSITDASTINKSKKLKPSPLNFLVVSPSILSTLSLANRIVKNKFESVSMVFSGSG